MGSWSPSAQSKIGVKAPTAPATAGAVGQRDGAPGGHRPAPMHMPQPGDPPILEAPYPDQEPFEAEATTTPLPPPLPPPSPAKSQPTAPKAKAPAAPVASAPAPDYLTPEEAEEEMLQQDADVAARNAAALRDVTPLEGRVIPWQSIATSLDDAVETGLSDGTFKTGIDASPEALKAKETRAKPTSLLDKARTYVPVLDIISPLPEDASPERKVAGLPEVAAHAEKSTDDAVKSASPLLQSFAAIPATTSGIPSPTLAVLSALTGVKPAEDRPQNALKAVAASSADETVRRGAVVDATLDEWARKLGTTRQALEAEADLRGIPWGEAVARAKKGDKAHEALNAAVKERGVNLANPARMPRPENIKIDDLEYAPTYRKGDESAGIMYSPEDDDLVVRPGELGYDAAMALIHASEEGGVDPYWVSAIQASTDPFKKYMEERVPDLANLVLSKRGVPEEKRNPGSIEYDEAMEAAWQRALSELVARKTVGLWAPPIFLDQDPGDVFGGVDVEGPGGAMIRYGEEKQKSFIADAARAGLPQVEVVGFGATTDPNHPTIVTRVRSPAATVFDVLDVPIYAATGAAEHYFDKNRSYFPGASEEQKAEIDRQREQAAQTSYGEAITSSIRARHDSVQGMMESDFAKPRYLYDSRGNLLKDEQGVPLETETWRPAVAALLGLGGAVVSPDTFMGVASVSKLGKMAGRSYSGLRDTMEVRGAARMLSEMTTARAAGQTLMREALDAEKAGDGVLAAEKQGEALRQFKRASDLEGRARSETPALARQLDIADATQAHRAAEANPDVLDAALTSHLDPASVGESGVAQAQLNVHPSQRRVNLGVDTKQLEAHYADYQDLFSPDQQIQRLDAAAKRVVESPELQRRLKGKLFESAAEPHLASLMKLAGEDEATAQALKTGIRTLGSSLGDTKAEKAAHQALLDARSMSPSLDAGKAKDAADAARRQKLRHDFILGVNDLVREARTLPDPVEVAKETRRRAIEAVLANSESRAIAAGTLSDALHRRAGNPNLGELTQGDPTLLAHERFSGAPSLSPRARRVADDLVAAGVKKEVAEGSAMLLDVRARVAATRKGTTADQEFGRLVRAAKDEHGSYRAWAAGEPGGEVLYAARGPLRGDADLAEAAASWRTGQDAASYLAKHAADEVHRVIAERIAPYVADVEVVQQPQLGYGMKTLESAGAYYPDANVLRLTPDADQQVVLHELMHAATANKLRAAPDAAEARKIDRLYQRALDEAERAGETSHYGLESRDEFIAEAFSNPDFQRFLRTVLVSPSKPETLWSSFVASVRSLLGLQGRGSTLLDETWQAVDDLLKAKSAGPAVPDLGKIGVAEGFFSPLQDAISEVFKKTGARKMSPDALLKEVRKLPGVKDDEVAWSGIESFLAGKEKVSAAEVEGWLRSREPVVEVRGLGPTGAASEELRKAAAAKADADAAVSAARQEVASFGIDADYPDTVQRVIERAQDVLDNKFLPPGLSSSARTEANEIAAQGPARLSQLAEAHEKWLQANDAAIEAGQKYDLLKRNAGNETMFGDYIAPGPSSNYREIRFLQNDAVSTADIGRARNEVKTAEEALEKSGLITKMKKLDPGSLDGLLEGGLTKSEVQSVAYNFHDLIGADKKQLEATIFDYIKKRRDLKFKEERAKTPSPGGSVRQHFEPNTLAHLRVSDRVDDQGRRVLFVEEAQSDWHQAGAKRGYATPAQIQEAIDFIDSPEGIALAKRVNALVKEDPNVIAADKAYHEGRISLAAADRAGDVAYRKVTADPAFSKLVDAEKLSNMEGKSVNPASHSDLWRELALKQAISLAAREGYDGVALTKADIIQGVVGGEEEGQAVFYNEMLPKTLDRLAGKDSTLGSTRLSIVADDAASHIERAERDLVRNERDAEVSASYDRPGEPSAITLHLQRSVERSRKNIEDLRKGMTREVPFLPITPALRDRVLNRGLPLYAPATQEAEKAGVAALPTSDLEAAERRFAAADEAANKAQLRLGKLAAEKNPDEAKLAKAREDLAKAVALKKGYASERARHLREAKRVEKAELEAGIRVLEEDPIANADIIRAARGRLAELAGKRGVAAAEAPISSPVLAQVEEATARIEKKAEPAKDLKALRAASSAASSEVYAKAKEIERIEARLKALRESPKSKDNVAHFNRVGQELAQAQREKKALVGQAAVARRELREAEAAVQETPTQTVRAADKVSETPDGTAKMSHSAGSSEATPTSRPVAAIRTNLRDVQERLRRALQDANDEVPALHAEQDRLLKELHDAEGMPEDEVEAVAAAEVSAPATPARAPASSGPAMLPEVTETRQVQAVPAPATAAPPAAPPASPPPAPPASATPPAAPAASPASRPFAVLFHDGEATLAAVRDSQNPRDLIHAIGHVIRRDLDADELEALNKVFEQEKIPARLTSEGKWVSPAGAGLSSAEIQGAEDVFADMLVNYVEHNTAPPGTSRSLNLLKEELKVVAASTQGAAESPAVAAFFDRLLGFEPDPAARKRASQAAADPRAFKASFWQRYVTGHPGTQASHGVFAELAKAAQQAGIDTDASRLQKQLERNGRIDFPVNVLGHGSYDADKIADMQKELGRIWAGSRDERVGRVPKRATIEGQPEQDLSEKLWSHAETPAATKAGNAAKAVERWALTPVLGQDAYRDLRKLPAPVRDDILVAQRKVESAYADALRLVSERRDSDLADFLLGKNVTTEHGRPLFSSGRSKAGPIRDLLSTYIADSKPNTQAALGFLGKYTGRIDELGEEERELAAIATAEFLYGDRAPLFNKQLTEVVGAPSAATTPGKVADARPQEMKLTGALVKFATAADPRDGLTALTTTLREQYGAEAAAQVAVLLSGHGAAAELPTVWKELGLAVSREDALLYKKWILGERIPEEKLGDIRRIARRVGLDAEFVETAILGDLARTPGMVPKEALDRALKVLSKSTPEKPHFLSSTDEIRDSAKAPDYAKGLATFISYNKAQKTRGVLLMRKMFTFTNTLDSVFNSAWSAGLLPSLMSSLRLTPHTMMVMTPALSRVIYHLEQANLLDKGTLEAVKDSLGKIGDVGAHAVATMSGRGGLRLDVSDILLGSDKVHIYGEGTRAVAHRASDLRTIAAEEGVFSTFPREIEKVFRHAAEGPHGTTGWAREWAAMAEEYVEDMTESWAERERLGLMVSLMELGYEPRQAARLTVTTLFDYGTSVTHAERSWIMGIFKPFWGYEKNIQRFTVNSLLRPTWAVRANAIRRATEYGPDAISDVLYAYSTDPYGIDPGALSPEARDSYYALRSEMESRYGGYEHMPKDVRQAITDLFHDTRGWQIRNGKLYEQNAALTPVVESANGQDYRFEPFSKERDSRGNLIPQHANLDISGAVVPKRDSSARSSIYRDRGGIVIPPYLDEATKKYLALAEAETGSRPYAEFYLPESGIEAGTRGVTAILATYANLMLKMVDALAQDPSSSLDALPVGAPMQYFMNPEMTMLLPEISDALFDSHLSMPARVSPQTAAAFRWAGWTVQEVNGAQDPYAIAAEHGEAPGSPDHAGNEAPAAPDFVDPAMQQRFKDTRYYLMPGRASLMWAYTGAPLDKLILKGERSPLERAQDGPGFDRADLEQALRVMIELPSQEVNRTQTAKREEPRFESTTTTPGGRMDEAGGL